MLEKLTAKEPQWTCAAIFVRDGQPTIIGKDHGVLRYLREEGFIEIKLHGVDDPMNPPIPARPTREGGMTAGTPGGKADQIVYFHVDDITRVDFFTTIPAAKLVSLP